jgi:predicted amidophosphoribosyltransferase
MVVGMKDRHRIRICRACGAPLGSEDDACWRCGLPWRGAETSARTGDRRPGAQAQPERTAA